MSAVRSAPEVRRRATIVGMRQLAMVNFDVLMEFELTVLPAAGPAARARLHAGRLGRPVESRRGLAPA